MARADPGEAPRFLFDLGSPACWLVAERILQVMPVATEWVPVAGRPHAPLGRDEVERRAAELGLQPVRWPPAVPPDSRFAMRAATYAKATGRTVAFALAGFRQAWCGGRDLGSPDTVLLAAAACELHPAAVLKGAALRSVGATLAAASADAERVPAIVAGGRTWTGEDAPERAAAELG